MDQINIEINIEEEKWQQVLPNVEEIITKACVAALKATKIAEYAAQVEVSVLLANDKLIQGLNRDYRNKDKSTNVLSFPLEELVAGNYKDINTEIAIGDIIFALETIQSEAIEQKKSFTDHLSHLAVHGALHLIGYDHEKEGEAEIMEALEIKILSGMGIESPY